MSTLIAALETIMESPKAPYLDAKAYGVLRIAMMQEAYCYGAYGNFAVPPGPFLDGRSGWFFQVEFEGAWFHLRESKTNPFKLTTSVGPSMTVVWQSGSDSEGEGTAVETVVVVEDSEGATQQAIALLKKQMVVKEASVKAFTEKIDIIACHSPQVAKSMESMLSNSVADLTATQTKLDALQATGSGEGDMM